MVLFGAMSDGFLTLANTPEGLSCFLVPRWLPDGTRNRIQVMRLKDKLGNKSNASSEIEYHEAWAEPIGPLGAGVRTIIEMVQHTRIDAASAPVGMMRQALVQALWHTSQRKAFGARLITQPLMQQVLADLALEVEGGLQLILRMAAAFDGAEQSAHEAALARVAPAVVKYWTNKRTPAHVVECMECHGGMGYVEESPMPRLYREAPVNSIWEGSGNVLCLDVLRAFTREPQTKVALWHELSVTAEPLVATRLAALDTLLADATMAELRARHIVEELACLWAYVLLRQRAAAAIADAWWQARVVVPRHGFGASVVLPAHALLARALPPGW